MEKIFYVINKISYIENNKDIALYIYKFYLQNKIYNYIKAPKSESDALPFRCNCKLNRIYTIVYQIMIYKLYDLELIKKLRQFLLFNLNVIRDFNTKNIKISSRKTIYLYNILIKEAYYLEKYESSKITKDFII